jgi:hypothetical protein
MYIHRHDDHKHTNFACFNSQNTAGIVQNLWSCYSATNIWSQYSTRHDTDKNTELE